MSWLSRLFGGGKPGPAASRPNAPTAEIEHHGFTIRATPFKSEGGQYQTAGTIVATIDDTVREHAFIRADRFGSLEDETAFSLQKGRQIVDEQGERLFSRTAGGAG